MKVKTAFYNALTLLKDDDESYGEFIIKSILNYDFNNKNAKPPIPEDGFIDSEKSYPDINLKKYLGITLDEVENAMKRQNYLCTKGYSSKHVNSDLHNCFILYFVEADYGVIIGVVIDYNESMNNKYHIFNMLEGEDKHIFK